MTFKAYCCGHSLLNVMTHPTSLRLSCHPSGEESGVTQGQAAPGDSTCPWNRAVRSFQTPPGSFSFIFSSRLPPPTLAPHPVSPLCRQLIRKVVLTPSRHRFFAPRVDKHWGQCQGRPPRLLPTYATQTRDASSTRDKRRTVHIFVHEPIRFHYEQTDTGAQFQCRGQGASASTYVWCLTFSVLHSCHSSPPPTHTHTHTHHPQPLNSIRLRDEYALIP